MLEIENFENGSKKKFEKFLQLSPFIGDEKFRKNKLSWTTRNEMFVENHLWKRIYFAKSLKLSFQKLFCLYSNSFWNLVWGVCNEVPL